MQTNTTAQKKSYYYFIIVACGMMLGIVFMGQVSMYYPMAPFIHQNLNLSHTQTSMITTVMNLATLTATFLITPIYDTFGVKKGLIIPLISGVGASVMFCIADNFVMVCIAGFLCQFSFGIGGMMPASLVVNRWFIKRKGLVLGLCSAGSGIAAMLFSGWVARTVAEGGVAAAQSVIAVVIGVSGLLIMFFIRNTPEEMGLAPYGANDAEAVSEKKSRSKTRLINIKPLSPKEKVITSLAVICCGATGFGALPNFTMAATSLGFDPVFVGSLIGVTGALSIFGKPFFGYLSDVLGPVNANAVYFILVALADLALFIVRPGLDFLLYGIIFVYGMCAYAITTIGIPIWAGDLSGEGQYSKNLRMFQLCSTLGGLIGAPFAGIIADATGNYGFYYLSLGILLTFALFVLGYMYKTHTKRVAIGEEA